MTPIQRLAKARVEKERADLALRNLRAAFDDAHAAEIVAVVEAKREIEDAEAAVKAASLAAYDESGDKQGYAGTVVKTFTTLSYKEGDALGWCLDKKLAVKLDAKAFEAIAKSTPLDFVTTVSENRVTIATDLAEFLP